MKILLLVPCILLAACSSITSRAPLYDVKSNKGNLNAKSAPYVAKGPSVALGQQEYVVQKGDTLYSIAWRASMNVDTLIKRNGLKSPYIIKEGQIIQLRESVSDNGADSQKRKKPPVKECTTQSCEQGHQTELVKKTPKEYSSNKVVKKTTKKQKNVKKQMSEKVGDWQWPSKGKLTKTFASSTQGMKGISISGEKGSPVYAAAAGKVVYAGSGLRGYGNLVIIKHNYDYLSAYAHNDNITIKENDDVKMGQKIATMGNSDSDSVRLHFDIRYRGKSVDPLRYLPKR